MSGELPITVITPQLPPAVCGVGDYTMRLIEAWNDAPRFRFLVARGLASTAEERPELITTSFACTHASLLAGLQASAGSHVLLQYAPHGYDGRGCPTWIAGALAAWRRSRHERARLVVMFHELWTRVPWWRPGAIRQLLHRQVIRRLVRAADRAFTNTPGYRGWLRKLSPDSDVGVVPIGSNIPPIPEYSREVREPGLFVLFGRQGTRIHALRTMGRSLARLHGVGRLRRLVIAGGGSSMAHEDRAVLRACLPESVTEQWGYVPAGELSRLLYRAEFGISDQTWDSVTKSTTFMAYASHGLNILSPYAGHDARAPYGWSTSAEELEERSHYLAPLLRERADHLRQWYRDTADWAVIAGQMKAAFNQPAGRDKVEHALS